MNDLISRQEAIKEIVCLPNCYDAYDKSCIIGVLEELPTIDPVKRGKWEMKPDPYGWFDEIPVCSACGCTTKWREKYAFCPTCGAYMQERKNRE